MLIEKRKGTRLQLGEDSKLSRIADLLRAERSQFVRRKSHTAKIFRGEFRTGRLERHREVEGKKSVEYLIGSVESGKFHGYLLVV